MNTTLPGGDGGLQAREEVLAEMTKEKFVVFFESNKADMVDKGLPEWTGVSLLMMCDVECSAAGARTADFDQWASGCSMSPSSRPDAD